MRHVLSIDLGTSRVKVGLVSARLDTVADAAASYPTLADEPAMAEQRPSDWVAAIGTAWRSVREARPDIRPDAVVLTAQMPTLVELDDSGAVIGHAITWQDSRADELVERLLTPEERHRLYHVAGTPIDGRYLLPMWRRRRDLGVAEATTVLSAKDYLYYLLTGAFVTDPSTASGFGCYNLDTQTFDASLLALFGAPASVLPRVAPSQFALPALPTQSLLEGLDPVPVIVGAADSVAAFHFVERGSSAAIAVIDGSSTVILAEQTAEQPIVGEPLLTPLVDASRRGVEMDLLATGSSILWLSRLFGRAPADLERLALSIENKAANATMVFPYLAGGEQGALWRTDLTGAIRHVHLGTSQGDIALALYEGIAFETLRCLAAMAGSTSPTVVALQGTGALGLVPALVAALGTLPVVPVAGVSPSLLGAALIAFDALGETVEATSPTEWATVLPPLEDEYRSALRAKQARYLAAELPTQ